MEFRKVAFHKTIKLRFFLKKWRNRDLDGHPACYEKLCLNFFTALSRRRNGVNISFNTKKRFTFPEQILDSFRCE